MLRKISLATTLAIVGSLVLVTGLPSTTTAATNVQIYSYAAKFVCQEAMLPGTVFLGSAPPIVEQKTDVLIHNPHGSSVTVFRKAVLAGSSPVAAGGKLKVGLSPDRAFRINCDAIARLLKNVSTGTFRSHYGTGVVVEGFVVIHSTKALDVTADYVRGSEVLKKDINYQPWWWYWPYGMA